MHSPLLLTRWQSPPDSTSWMKTAGPSGLLDPPPMVMPKLLDRATEMSWITPSPGWLRTHRHIDTHTCILKLRQNFLGLKNLDFVCVSIQGRTLVLHCWPYLREMLLLIHGRVQKEKQCCGLIWVLLSITLPERSQHCPAAVVHVLRSCWAQQQGTLGARWRPRWRAVQVAASFNKNKEKT